MTDKIIVHYNRTTQKPPDEIVPWLEPITPERESATLRSYAVPRWAYIALTKWTIHNNVQRLSILALLRDKSDGYRNTALVNAVIALASIRDWDAVCEILDD